MKILITIITALLLMQNTVGAEQPWRFINLTDWHRPVTTPFEEESK